MNNSVCIVTGSNTGIGYETAYAFAQDGCDVVVACRDSVKGRQAADRINAAVGSSRAAFMPLDLSALDSVRAFAEAFLSAHDRLDVLICNAGVMSPPYARTRDGFESQFQINYLSHFLLTQLLLEAVLASGRASVIHVSSLSSEKGASNSAADFERWARVSQADYAPMTSYRESKLAQVLFAAELHRRYGGRGLKASAVHPGVVNTELFYRRMGPGVKTLAQAIAKLGYVTGLLKTPKQGAETSIYLARNAGSITGGQYWADCRPRTPNARMQDQALGREMWEASFRWVE